MADFNVHTPADNTELLAWRELKTQVMGPNRYDILKWPTVWPEPVALVGFLIHRTFTDLRQARISLGRHMVTVETQKKLIEEQRIKLKARDIYDTTSEGWTHRIKWRDLSWETQAIYINRAKELATQKENA